VFVMITEIGRAKVKEAHERSRDEAGLRRHQSRRPLGRSHPSPRRCPASRALIGQAVLASTAEGRGPRALAL
jgi:hypothetical protein